MKKLLLIGILWNCVNSFSQVIYLETFTYANSTTSGTDDIGGVAWNATCPYCDASVTTDYFHVDGNALENRDSNGPAYWETDEIDISACTDGVTISLDLAEVGTLEGTGVTCAGGCSATDVVKLEVSYDGGANWDAYSDATNGTISTDAIACDCGTCGAPNTTFPVPWCGDTLFGPTIATDDFTSAGFSDCINLGISSTIKLRITTMTWAGTEYITVDNVQLECTSCLLPAELYNVQGQRTEESVLLTWSTLSESDNKKFIIERSSDGVVFEKIGAVKGVGESTSRQDYSFADTQPLGTALSYYRIKQMDKNGTFKNSDIIAVKYIPHNIIYDGVNITISFNEIPSKSYQCNIYNTAGELLHKAPIHNQDRIAWDTKGFYIIEIPELEIKEKIVIP